MFNFLITVFEIPNWNLLTFESWLSESHNYRLHHTNLLRLLSPLPFTVFILQHKSSAYYIPTTT